MSVPDGEAEMEAAYQAVKKKYQELKALRIESVLADSADLRQKIEEHRRVHARSVAELQAQNNELRKLIQQADSTRSEVDRLADSVAKIRAHLQQRDPVLAVFLKYPIFTVRSVGRRIFEIRAGGGDPLAFTLRPSAYEDEFQFHFTEYPASFRRSRDTDFVCADAFFKATQLQGFCDHLRRGLEALAAV
jgi:hypothetical protein